MVMGYELDGGGLVGEKRLLLSSGEMAEGNTIAVVGLWKRGKGPWVNFNICPCCFAVCLGGCKMAGGSGGCESIWLKSYLERIMLLKLLEEK